MPFGQAHVPGLRVCMAAFAAIAFLLGVVMSFEGNASVALTNFCGALFFIFAYHNPAILLVTDGIQRDVKPADVAQKKFLWTSLAVGLLAIGWEFVV